MKRGFTITELVVCLAVIGLVTALALPRLAGWLDWIAVDTAATRITTALAVARNAAVAQGTRARVVIAADSLRIDRWNGTEWQPFDRWPGPADAGVRLDVSEPVVTFGATGLGWGLSNTRVVLRRGSQTETITTSRLGRVKRW